MYKKLMTAMLVTFTTITSHAALFQQWNQDAAGLGNNQAGRAAIADDASTEFYNPAGLVLMDHQQWVVGGVGLMPSYDYSGSATYSTTGLTSTRTGDAQGGEFSAYPYMHYVAPLSDKWAFGFGVSSPFSIDSNWGDGASVAYAASSTEFETYDISTDLAYALTPTFSIGAGLDMVRVIVTDYDHETPLNTSGSSVYTTELNGTDWEAAWHAGVLYQLNDTTRVGFNYASKIDFSADGTGSTESATGTRLVTSNRFEIDGTLPAVSVLSAIHNFNTQLTGMASVTYTEWSQLNDLKYKNVPTNTGIISEQDSNYDFNDTWGVNLGANYQLNRVIMLRAGVGYESSPVDGDETYIRSPSDGLYSISIGVHMTASKTFSFDLGWQHLFYGDDDVATTKNSEGTNTTLSGTLDDDEDVIAVQLVWNFA